MGGMKKSKNSRLQRQREKILSVSGRLFWQKGYLATSIDDIAEGCRMNKASIYYYFNNKAALLYELSLASIQVLIDQGLLIMKSKLQPEEKLKAFISNHINFALTNLGLSGIGQLERRNLPAKLLRSYVSMRDEYEGIFRKILKEGTERKKFRFRDIKLASLFILGFMNSIVQWYKATGKLSTEEIAMNAYAFVSRALSAGE